MQEMQEKKVKFVAVEDVRDFVIAAERCDFDIDVWYEHAIVDAKSFMGLLSLGVKKALTVKYCGANHEFEDILVKYAAA